MAGQTRHSLRRYAANEKLAERYAGHPALIAWHVSNEYGGDCRCPLCRAADKDKFICAFHCHSGNPDKLCVLPDEKLQYK